MSDDTPSSLPAEPINPKIPSVTVKHIYFDDEHDDNENSLTQKIIERPTSSTIRIDSSDLLSRCKDFLPLLSDTNQNSTDKTNSSEQEDEKRKFPDIAYDILSDKSSKESGEASTTATDDDEKQKEIIKKKRKKKKKKKKKKLKTNDDANLNT